MAESGKTVRLYFAPLQYPCGPNSSCCGPVGQSEQDVAGWKRALEAALPGTPVETIDVSQPLRMGRDSSVIRLLNSFGHQACPIIAVDREVISMGPPKLHELVGLIQCKLVATGVASSRG